jgi:hypothetical protein
MAQKIDGSRIGFLATCFLLVCLVGVFASSATPIPYARGLLKEQALDEALATAGKPNQPALLAALSDRLGEQADLVINGPGALPQRVAQARGAARAEAHRLRGLRHGAFRRRADRLSSAWRAGGTGCLACHSQTCQFLRHSNIFG